jgi:hypothetical protein
MPYAFLMMTIVLKLCYEVINHYVLSHRLSFLPALCTFLHIAYILSLLLHNGASYIWQMVCMRTGDFTQDVPELSNARAGAVTSELCNAARRTPPPPPPPPPHVSVNQLLAM